MFYYRVFTTLTALVLLVLTSCASHPPAPSKPERLQDNLDYVAANLEWMITREMSRKAITGLSIALVTNRRIVWQQGFGFANKKTREAVTPMTLFRAGSLIKPLNAIAVMQLVEREKVSLNTAIDRYLRGFRPQSRFEAHSSINAKSLLSHQSGLPSDLIKGMWTENPEHFAVTLDYLNRSFLAQPPDTIFRYSNLAHNVIGALIAQRSAKTYTQVMHALLNALDMRMSRVSASPNIPPTASGYEKGKIRRELSLRDVPAAGLTSNVVDLAQLIKFFHARGESNTATVLSMASVDTLLADYTSHNPLNLNNRHGLGLYHYDGVFHSSAPVFGHGGASVNHRALVKFAPQQKIGVALLSNSKNSSPSLHKIANQALKLLFEAQTGRPAPMLHRFWPIKTPADQTDQTAIAGLYATPIGLAKIAKKRGRLEVVIGGKRFHMYQRQPGGLYYLKYKLFGVVPVKIGYLANLGISMRHVKNRPLLIAKNTVGSTTLLGEKITPQPIPQAWQKRIGKYKIANPLAVITFPSGGINVKEGFLVAYAKTETGNRMEVVLQPLNDQEAIVMGFGRGLGETVTSVKHEGQEFLSYSHMLFEKR